MPKCNRCPIKPECNKNPILVDAPKTNPKTGKSEKIRLCPLIIAVGYAIRSHNEEFDKSEKNKKRD